MISLSLGESRLVASCILPGSTVLILRFLHARIQVPRVRPQLDCIFILHASKRRSMDISYLTGTRSKSEGIHQGESSHPPFQYSRMITNPGIYTARLTSTRRAVEHCLRPIISP